MSTNHIYFAKNDFIQMKNVNDSRESCFTYYPIDNILIYLINY